MRKFRAIIQAEKEPEDIHVIWHHKGKLLYYENGDWITFDKVTPEDVKIKIDTLPGISNLKEVLDYLAIQAHNYRIVKNKGDLYLLKPGTFNEGTHCYVIDEDTEYIFSVENNTWVKKTDFKGRPFKIFASSVQVTSINYKTRIITFSEDIDKEIFVIAIDNNAKSVDDLGLCTVVKRDNTYTIIRHNKELPTKGQYVYIVGVVDDFIDIPIIQESDSVKNSYNITFYTNTIIRSSDTEIKDWECSIFVNSYDIYNYITVNDSRITNLELWKADIDSDQRTQNALIEVNKTHIEDVDRKIDELAFGVFYGYFPDSISLPTDVTTPGYAYVGLDNPYRIWNFKGESWSDSGTSIDMNDTDEEDITRNVDGKLQFKNKEYGDGMGYIILRKNKSFAEQVTKENTIYEIRYNFDLNGEEISIPKDCILKFEGGSISNGILANIGKCINANNGFKANIKSFSKTLSFIKTSWFSVNENSQPEHNLNILQTAIDYGLSIIIDTTKDKFDSGIGIMLDSPLKIKDGGLTIKGTSEFGGGLIFKNSDGFVFVNKRYYQFLKFDNLNITSKGYCFNFCNEENGVINEVRPYNIYFSTFSNLKVKSLEKDCFYQGDVAGAGGDGTPIFSVLFDNIYLWTTRFGFNGIHGQTDFVVQNLKDIYVPNSFFKNTAPSIVRNVNSTFGDKNSRASHFMVFDDKIINYGISINCDNCSWEGYRGEIFYEQIETNQELVKREYNINLTNCAFGYYKSDFNNGKLNIYPITLNKVGSIKFSNVKNLTVEYDTGYSLCRFVSKCDKIQSDVDFSCYYGLKSTGEPIGFIEYHSIWASPSTNLGNYPNSYYEYKTLAQNIDVSKSKVRGMIYTTIDVTDNKTPIIKTDYTVFTTSKNTSIDYIIYNQLYGNIDSKYKETGRILYFYNKSDYSITFNDGYQPSVVSQDVRKFILHPNEFAIVCFNSSKGINQYSVIKRINSFDNFGSTAKRPSLTINEEGFEYYDSTLKKKILWNGTEWTNIDGTSLE